ncbi:tRNA (adenosine(37)-N6)-dimethylallyltransferase MiaA [Candidatus Nitronereus thalassa]|uniref:tRNA dimethylallyltransferase n=1 Tax=Candidatus Nitronereus thalassa TaxID=3020898 RepID=A0ABU3KB53_9BACT|nr:tRNA (adenosine(37)-N6)-dimethylallyltransferase MiaA [Candidatus Nitronereus thalassa]MDT7043653.1 tRNA (adenosine(37)-N6)-dimethylallyltransferase MiaA [Candidatus Nitronereus thalassa]
MSIPSKAKTAVLSTNTSLLPVIVLVGPTAIGKSRVAIEMAKALGTEVLTADSTQVYRGMDIGTDKPSFDEREDVPHRLIDLVNPDEPFNAGEYRYHAVTEIERLHREGRIPLVVGGTGLYIRALLRGLWPGPPVDWTLRRALEREAEDRGLSALYQELGQVDPERAQKVHPNDAVKVLRALEIFRQTGVPASQAHDQHGFQDRPFHALMLGLTMDREALYRRIEERVHVEIEKGLVEETRRLLAQGYSRNLTSMKSLGYRQMAGFLEGDYDYNEAVRLLKRDTRHFAKRQMTWFRKEPEVQWVSVLPDESISNITARIMTHVHRFMTQVRKETKQNILIPINAR